MIIVIQVISELKFLDLYEDDIISINEISANASSQLYTVELTDEAALAFKLKGRNMWNSVEELLDNNFPNVRPYLTIQRVRVEPEYFNKKEELDGT